MTATPEANSRYRRAILLRAGVSYAELNALSVMDAETIIAVQLSKEMRENKRWDVLFRHLNAIGNKLGR